PEVRSGQLAPHLRLRARCAELLNPRRARKSSREEPRRTRPPDSGRNAMSPLEAHQSVPVMSSPATGAALVSRDLPAVPTVDPSWLLIEEGCSLAREHEVESRFTVANGYVGTRGSLDEGTSLSAPATYLA